MEKAPHAPLAPEILAGYLDGTGIRWWVTGTHMLNQFLGRQLRPPRDLDVQIIREDLPRALVALSSWQHYYVDARAWFRWRGQTLPSDIRRLVSRPSRAEPWAVEWLMAETERDHWVYHYDSRVRLRWDAWDHIDSHGVRYAPPEVALLYKSKMARPKDHEDFIELLPHLDARRRAWLADAITLGNPGHPWLPALRTGGSSTDWERRRGGQAPGRDQHAPAP